MSRQATLIEAAALSLAETFGNSDWLTWKVTAIAAMHQTVYYAEIIRVLDYYVFRRNKRDSISTRDVINNVNKDTLTPLYL
jgi:hypothetical protein